MKRKTIPLLLVIFLLSGQTSWALAQQTATGSDWSAVQRIGTDEKVIVKRTDGKEFKGRMIEATDSTLRIDRDGKPFDIPRAEVRQVHVITGKAEKGKYTAIGAAIGAGAGLAIGGANESSESDDSEIYTIFGTVLGTGIGAVGGLLFGAAKRKHVLIYQA